MSNRHQVNTQSCVQTKTLSKSRGVLRSQWIQIETNNRTVVEDIARLRVYSYFIQKVKMKIHALSLHLLKPLLAKLNKILVMHGGVKEDGHNSGAVMF
jgi:hypothetical protein